MDQKNLIVAALLSVIVLVGWSLLFPSENPTPTPQDGGGRGGFETAAPTPRLFEESAPLERVSAVASARATQTELEPISDEVEREVEIESASVIARFTNRGAQLISLRLRNMAGRDGQPLEMVRRRSVGPYPFAIVDPNGQPSRLNDMLFVIEPLSASSNADGSSANGTRFVYRGPEGNVVKEFRFDENGFCDVSITVEGSSDWSLLMGPGLRNPTDEELGGRYSFRAASYLFDGEIERTEASKAREAVAVPGANVDWVGLEDTYFVAILAPATPFQQAVFVPMLPEPAVDGLPRFIPHPGANLTEAQEELGVEFQVLLQPGRPDFQGRAFFGAKRYEELKALPGGLELEKSIKWGIWGFLALPMLWSLLWIHDHLIANFGWSIIILTFCIKVLMAPLTHKSFVSSRRMQAIQPKMQAIKQKWRSKLKDKRGRPNLESQRKQNEELQALMKAEGVNPLGGCLPMIFQMPFFFAFFTLLRFSVELWNEPWAFWIHDLSAKDPLYILPLVMGASQFLQQRLMGTTSMEPAQKAMMNVMPIMFMFFFFGAPSGLVLYWVTSNLLTISQQAIYQRLKATGILGGKSDDPAAQKTSSKKG